MILTTITTYNFVTSDFCQSNCVNPSNLLLFHLKLKGNENVEILTFFTAADIYPSYQRVRSCQVQSIMFPTQMIGAIWPTRVEKPRIYSLQ